MKIARPLCAAFALFAVANTASAFTPPYHVTEGYFGSATFRASGSCGFKPVTYKNAWLGSVLDSTDAPVGWGVITASGELLVLEASYARVKYSENVDIGVGKDISYTDMVGSELITFITNHSGCSIRSIVPDTNSRTAMKWDTFKGKDRVQMKANFNGFEEEVCQTPQTGKQCHADKFSGSVTFKGDWSTPG
ncbi:MAG TPA: hypothetical protein VLB90_00735 [Pseudomonadales bacterium]|nr:hypothetical protein [Pseudomonadales bacterium]